MEHPDSGDLSAQVALLGTRMLGRAGELADAMVERIRAAVPVYRSDAVITAAELRRPAWRTSSSSSGRWVMPLLARPLSPRTTAGGAHRPEFH